MSKQAKTYTWMGIIVLVIILLGWWFVYLKDSPTPVVESQSNDSAWEETLIEMSGQSGGIDSQSGESDSDYIPTPYQDISTYTKGDQLTGAFVMNDAGKISFADGDNLNLMGGTKLKWEQIPWAPREGTWENVQYYWDNTNLGFEWEHETYDEQTSQQYNGWYLFSIGDGKYILVNQNLASVSGYASEDGFTSEEIALAQAENLNSYLLNGLSVYVSGYLEEFDSSELITTPLTEESRTGVGSEFDIRNW